MKRANSPSSASSVTKKKKVHLKDDQTFEPSWTPISALETEYDHLNEHKPNIAELCKLFNAGATVPFIVRYRRNFVGNLGPDEVRTVQDKYEDLKTLQTKCRKLSLKISSLGKMTPSVRSALAGVKSDEDLEIVSVPFKAGSKQTLAGRAREVGLEEAAEKVLSGSPTDLRTLVRPDVKGLASVAEVETGLGHIIAEVVAHDQKVREKICEFQKSATNIMITSKKTKKISESDTSKFQLYLDYSCRVPHIKPHQVLALNRGESLKALTVKVVVPEWMERKVKQFCMGKFVSSRHSPISKRIIDFGISDGYKRLLEPFLMRKVRSDLTKEAEQEAIGVFGQNLRRLLLMPPFRGKTVLAIDPGFAHGCKTAVLSGSDSSVLDTFTMYPRFKTSSLSPPDFSRLSNAVDNFGIETIAIGNGTACRETEKLIAELIRTKYKALTYTIVNEQGASIYSCSPEASAEFPGLDPNVIGAVSIGRRLIDPMAEYVKIEPKHLGVGMYQHDVPESKLKKLLDEIVVECVSFVGVDVNTAPIHILRKVSGLNASTAKAIGDRREKKPFQSRIELKKVKGIGEKVFEQCSGFLLVSVSSDPLDRVLVHPEMYGVAEKLLKAKGMSVEDIGSQKFKSSFKQLMDQPSEISSLALKLSCPGETIRLLAEVFQQGFLYDIRAEQEKPMFRREIVKLTDLRVGLSLTGHVTNVTPFGAFVDVGVSRNALLHSSKMCGQSIQLGQRVEVVVDKIDGEKIGVRLKEVVG